MKSDELKTEIEGLIEQFNRLVEEERRIGQSKNQMMMEIQKKTGMYEAYLEMEKDSDSKEAKKNAKK